MVGLEATDSEFSRFIGWGELTPHELIGAYTVFVNSTPTRLVLWDLRSATLAQLHAEDLSAVARSLARLAIDRRPPGKSTLVVGRRQAEYAKARMLAGFLWILKYPVDVEVFRNLEDASVWLLEAEAQPGGSRIAGNANGWTRDEKRSTHDLRRLG
jgi:hypothetical protein